MEPVDPEALERAITAFKGGLSVRAAAELVGITGTTLARYLDERGIDRPRHKPATRRKRVRKIVLDSEQATQIVNAYSGGRSTQDILSSYEIPADILYGLLEERGVPLRRDRVPGWRTDISEPMKDEIIAAYQEMGSLKAVAEAFRVGRPRVVEVLDERQVPRRRRP